MYLRLGEAGGMLMLTCIAVREGKIIDQSDDVLKLQACRDPVDFHGVNSSDMNAVVCLVLCR
jgi:hypothetical protein